MSSKLMVKAGFAAAALSVASMGEASAQSQNALDFCDSVREHGARSWQAMAEYDAMNHGGSNLYAMSPQEREAAVDRMLAFVPPELAAQVRAQMMERIARFDEANASGKLIQVIQELQGHGTSMNDYAAAAARCGR